MTAFLIWLEMTSFSTWLRESPSILAFPAVLILHTVGLAFLAGISAAIDLRILGFVPGIPLAPFQSLFPIIWWGFWLNAVSGVVLLIAYPAKSLTNPLFFLKLSLIAAALVVFRQIRIVVFSDPDLDKSPVARKGRLLAASSLFLWIAAITAGRLLAYTYTHLLLYADI
jgi:hypothetical protein